MAIIIFNTVRTASLVKLSHELNLQSKNKFDKIKRKSRPTETYLYEQVQKNAYSYLGIPTTTSRRRKI
jgi:hypothetical protein